ncbi:ADP ribosylation factor family Ras of Complex Roc domain [Trypanosoma vivax]|uniref:Putative ras-related GTP-binding protein n=1 Tax=Trypanosoma vivax (strain Y486) TaxID=1055687 RepID=G0U8H2_TRYVY|nr:putative ras-related GTP-binding protein [Trypanosoma vivax]KAH8605092.1 ADP ribosylation factor family Ras of Complex Roc domain [Trypanosoma vivax]CCC53898.1 putative ras-related GTP-binding protein [Trypanosoma vivax Y486]
MSRYPGGQSSAPSDADPRIKIVSLGSTGVGKSCLIKHFCEGRFVAKYIPTIGIDYGVKRVEVRAPRSVSSATSNVSVRVNFWDMSGGNEFLEVRNEFYGAAEGILLVYDVTDAASFSALEGWLGEADKYRNTKPADASAAKLGDPRRYVTVVCGNKVDEAGDNGSGGKRRAVTEATGRKWAQDRGFKYFETSACTGAGVMEAFQALFTDVVAAFF